MRRPFATIAAIAITIISATALYSGSRANAQSYGWGMMSGYGPGMMYGEGPGMMYGPGYGHMMGPWMMGPGALAGQGNLNLSADDVKNYFSRLITLEGNSRLKVGDVKEKDSDSITADIVTKDNSSLVQRFVVDRHNGFYRPYEG